MPYGIWFADGYRASKWFEVNGSVWSASDIAVGFAQLLNCRANAKPQIPKLTYQLAEMPANGDQPTEFIKAWKSVEAIDSDALGMPGLPVATEEEG